jgi:outer membrane biogenesis lipoprotein LolB
MEASEVQINVPKSDLPFLRKIAKGMGWTITSTKKSGIDLGLEDIKAGRVYRAANAEEMLSQILG